MVGHCKLQSLVACIMQGLPVGELPLELPYYLAGLVSLEHVSHHFRGVWPNQFPGIALSAMQFQRPSRL